MKAKFHGVWARSEHGPYKASICLAGMKHTLGEFPTAEEAARAYDKAQVQIRGANSRSLNFPLEDYKELLPQDPPTPSEKGPLKPRDAPSPAQDSGHNGSCPKRESSYICTILG